ncbi:MAG: hypothetical protein Ct9H90mP20_6500 [Candidatus Neomarinimicrobiota bacterium]|nr:MAG: hypothetical protein Ct9H90mP20_6500 [Candidatus Neomarinimicrobiota bacterium]
MLHARAIIPIKIGNRTISDEMLKYIGVFYDIYFNFYFNSPSLSIFNLDFQSAFSAAASAIGNVGPHLVNLVPQIIMHCFIPRQWMLTFCML